MSLNDDLEKLRTAEDWLLEYPAHSQEFEAALEHVLITHKTREDLRNVCANVLKTVIKARHAEERVMAKMKNLT